MSQIGAILVPLVILENYQVKTAGSIFGHSAGMIRAGAGESFVSSGGGEDADNIQVDDDHAAWDRGP